ncbi:hypothetical protein [Streptodolium elevatio]|uniref:Lipoprotein n=1 Tax=Streptodolium elevatio TaxID=3157996 RepID=A0ABV3DQ58_9ACTN
MRVRRIAAVASATVLAAVALSACGSDDGGADNTKTEAKALADKAVEFAKKSGSMEAVGKGTEDGKAFEVKSCVNVTPEGKSESVKGSLTRDGRTAEVLTTGGKDYFKASAEFYILQAGQETTDFDMAALSAALDGKWMVSDEEEPDDSADFFEGNTDGVTKGEVTEFNGKKAVPLTKKDKDGKEKTVYVAAKGDPVVLGVLEVEDGTRTETTISGVGKPCDVKAPAQEQTLTEDEVDKLFDEARQTS